MDIKQLQKLFRAPSNVMWSKHCLERMQERDIGIEDIESCLESGEVIEDYPNDFPHPSCLIFGYTNAGKVLHTIVGLSHDTIFLISAYYPSTDKFEDDLKTRKG